MRYRTQQLSTKFANKQRAQNVERKYKHNTVIHVFYYSADQVKYRGGWVLVVGVYICVMFNQHGNFTVSLVHFNTGKSYILRDFT